MADCFKRLRELYKQEDISDDLLRKLTDDMEEIYQTSRDIGDYKKYSKQYLDNLREDRAIMHKAKIEGQLKLREKLALIQQDAFKGEPTEGLRAVIHGSNRLTKGGNRSIELDKKVIEAKHLNMLHTEFVSRDLFEVVKGGAIDKEIAEELFQLTTTGGKPGKTGNRYALEAAQVLQQHYKGLLKELQLAGIPVRELEGRVVRNTHDPSKVRGNGTTEDFGKWLEATLPKLDPERTFGHIKNDLDKIHNFMKAVWADISSDILERGPGVQSRRVLHFKDGVSWFEYNKLFGKDTLLDTVLAETHSVARRASLVNHLGLFPEEQFGKLKKAIKRTISDDPVAILDFQRNEKDLDTLFKMAMGGEGPPVTPLAKFGANSRLMAGMARLGMSLMSTFTDLATSAASLRGLNGKGMLENTLNLFTSFMSVIPEKERLFWAKKTNIYIQDMLGEHFSRFTTESAQPGVLSKMSNVFYKMNGMSAQTAMGKAADARQLAIDIGQHLNSDWKSLGAREQAGYGRYGVTEKEWGYLQNTKDSIDGLSYFAIEKIDELKIPEKEKSELYKKMSSLITDHVELGVLTPGFRERHFFLRGSSQDTAQGQFLRFIAQFKEFPLSMYRAFSRAAMSDPDQAAKSMGDILRGKGDKSAMIGLMLSTTALAYIGMSARSIIQGKTPPDPTKGTTWLEAFARGGSAALAGDFLLAEYDKNYRSVTKDIAGPVLGQADDILKLWASVLRAPISDKEFDEDRALGKAMNLIMNNVPGQNLLFIRSALDFMILNDIQESLSPGHIKRMERAAEERGQRYLISP